MIANTQILVTGGAGAIGSNVVTRLCKDNFVIVLDDLSSGHIENLPKSKNILFINGSVSSDKMLRKCFMHKPEIVLHLAANFANQNSVDHPRKDLDVNGAGTLKLLEYSRDAGIRRFIYASSSCVYGHVSGALSETKKDYNLDTPYAITKLLGERYTSFFHHFYKLNTVILRYFNSYGPREYPGKYRNVIPNFFKTAIEGKPLPITGNGDESRDFNFADDTVEGTILALAHEEAVGKTFNLGSGKETRIIELAEKINQITKNRAGIRFVGQRDWDSIKRRLADISLANTVLGYKPKVDLDTGLMITYKWLKSVL